MATKTGAVQRRDIRQGRTFYEVTLSLSSDEKTTISVRPAYCCSGLWRKKRNIGKNLPISFFHDRDIFSLSYCGFEKVDRDGLNGAINYRFDDLNLPLTGLFIHNRRLFVTRNAAERFAEYLRRTFEKSYEQDNHAFYYNRWSNALMKDLTNQQPRYALAESTLVVAAEACGARPNTLLGNIT
jgi:hypothetical protein